MKMKKILAAAAAMAVCGTMAVAASADYDVPADYFKADDAGTVFLVGDAEKGENGPFNDKLDDLAKCTGVKFTIQLDETEAADCATGGGTWVGGGVGFNSESTGWEKHEWTPKPYNFDDDGNPVDADGDGTPDPAKELTLTKVSDGVYEVEFSREDGSSIFQATDTYAQIWLQDWSTGNAKLTGVTLIGVDAPADATTENTDPGAGGDTDTETPSDDNKDTGAAAGIALAGLALAGAAVVVTKKNK